MKKSVRKLALSRETLRALTEREFRKAAVRGGWYTWEPWCAQTDMVSICVTCQPMD